MQQVCIAPALYLPHAPRVPQARAPLLPQLRPRTHAPAGVGAPRRFPAACQQALPHAQLQRRPPPVQQTPQS